MEKINIEWQIPESKEDISLSQWLEYESVLEINKGKDNNDFLNKKMLEIFCKVPFEYINQLPQIEIDEMLGYLNFVFGQKSELIKSFVFEDVEYGFIPDYDKDITAAEHWDLQQYSEAKDWVKVLSILYRPITIKEGKLYQIEPYSGTHNLFLNLRYDVFDGCIGFFLRVMQQLYNCTLQFTQKELMKLKMNKMNTHPHLANLEEVMLNLNSLTNMEY